MIKSMMTDNNFDSLKKNVYVHICEIVIFLWENVDWNRKRLNNVNCIEWKTTNTIQAIDGQRYVWNAVRE